ncbi:MAG: hypothetical protein LIO69_09950 [Oscillospiraceae bacterium]|nr:hypothetical protein [Oscillospiraceae bacterium]
MNKFEKCYTAAVDSIEISGDFKERTAVLMRKALEEAPAATPGIRVYRLAPIAACIAVFISAVAIYGRTSTDMSYIEDTEEAVTEVTAIVSETAVTAAAEEVTESSTEQSQPPKDDSAAEEATASSESYTESVTTAAETSGEISDTESDEAIVEEVLTEDEDEDDLTKTQSTAEETEEAPELEAAEFEPPVETAAVSVLDEGSEEDVPVGASIEESESSGDISHKFDVRVNSIEGAAALLAMTPDSGSVIPEASFTDEETGEITVGHTVELDSTSAAEILDEVTNAVGNSTAVVTEKIPDEISSDFTVELCSEECTLRLYVSHSRITVVRYDLEELRVRSAEVKISSESDIYDRLMKLTSDTE